MQHKVYASEARTFYLICTVRSTACIKALKKVKHDLFSFYLSD